MPAAPTTTASDRELRALLRLVPLLMSDEAEGALPSVDELPLRLMREHLLGPLAFHRGRYPEFRNDFIAASLFAERREKLMAEAVAAMAAVQVRVAPIKGIAYTERIYGDPALRPMTDMDLLVPRAEQRRAIEALEALGYVCVDTYRDAPELHHAVTFRRDDSNIDLHHTIVQPSRSRFDLDAVWGRATAPDADGEAWELELVDLLLIHLIHAGRHELLVSAVSYVDAARMLRMLSADQLRELHDRARAARVTTLVEVAIEMTRSLEAGERPRWRGRLRVLPDCIEVLRYQNAWRPLQLVRKLAVTEGAGEVIGLAVGYLRQQARARRSRS